MFDVLCKNKYFYKVKLSKLTLGFLFILSCIVIASCKDYSSEEKMMRLGAEYFSVKQYIFGQYTNFKGNPFSILKTVTIDGKTDSTYTNSDKIDWIEIFDIFFETDISDMDLVGHYRFTKFEDEQDRTMNFYFQAADDNLFTQKLLVTANPYTNHIKGIFIETRDHSLFLGDTNQKLFYSPFKLIQIQTYTTPLFGKPKSKVVQYYLLH